MKTRLFIVKTTALFCAVVCLLSCIKNPKQNGTIKLKGKLTDSCGGTPFAFMKVRARYYRPVGFKPIHKDPIGSGTTDANGNFEIECQNWGKGLITIYGGSQPFIKDYSVENEQGKTFDFGEIPRYSSVKATIKVTIVGSFDASDTLFIADKWYYPIPTSTFTDYLISTGDQTENIDFGDSTLRVRTRKLSWGIGATNKPLNGVVVNYSFCGIPEQINEITISK